MNFHPLEVVACGSETQLQMGRDFDKITGKRVNRSVKKDNIYAYTGIPFNKLPSSEVPKFRSFQVPGTSSSQVSSSGNFKFRNKKKHENMFNKKHFRYCLLPFHAL